VLNREQKVKECDAREAEKTFFAWQIKISFLLANANKKAFEK
jgi:hypothetical protein